MIGCWLLLAAELSQVKRQLGSDRLSTLADTLLGACKPDHDLLAAVVGRVDLRVAWVPVYN